jgi:DNA-binding transcriptional LysR family regulator
MKNLNLDQLRSFADVVELGSFSAAAERQGISQPAISLQIRQLEKQLGVTLLERIARKARPTAAGAELLTHAARIDAAVAATLESMARHATGTYGRVRLGTGATACIFLLPPLLRDLRRRHPTLEITVHTGDTAEIVRDIEENILDIALVTLPASGRMLEVIPVMEDELVLIAPPETRLPERVPPKLLATLPLVQPPGNTRRLADEWLARAGLHVKPVMSLGSVEAIKELVGAGLGCAVLPKMALPEQSARTKKSIALTVRPLQPRLYRKLAVVIRKDKTLHRGLRETLKALEGLGKKG